MSVIGVKQLKLWFISGTGARPLNPRGFTVDFQNNGEPDTAVFRNLIESVTNKRNGDDFQDQAMYSDINTRTVPDKFVTPNNLPITAAPSGSVVSVTPVAATDELASGNPYITYNLDVHKATYADISAKNADVALTGANYPTVTSTTLTVTPVEVGDSIDYQVELPALPSVELITDVTYTALVNLINTSALVPGTWYRFPYQCIHQIPYTNVLNTSSTLTIPTEHLLVQAINTNTLDRTQVRSMEHPQDIIHWRWEDNTVVMPITQVPLLTTNVYLDTLDQGNPNSFTKTTIITDVSPTTSRSGRIYYREDTIQRISTPYDFRGVVFRRWALTKDGSNNYIFANALTYTPTTLYKHHDIILDSGTYYLVIYPFTATSSISNHTSNLTSLGAIYNSTSLPQFVASNPTSHLFYSTDDQYFTSTTVAAVVDSTTFNDSFTFTISGGTVQAYNVRIADYIPAWIEAVTWEFYPNIVFGSWTGPAPTANIKIGNFSYDLTIYNGTSITIGDYCRDIFINGRANGNIGNIEIKDNNQYIHIDQYSSGGESTLTKRLITSIGFGNKGLILSGGAYNIADNNNRILSYTTSNIAIGNSNYVVGFIGGSNEVGDFNSFTMFNSCVLNSVGHRNRNIFNISGTNTKIGSFNTDITSLKPNTIEGVATPHSYNVIGDYCSSIIISGTSNYFNNVSNLTYSTLFVFTNCTFDGISTLTFSSSSSTYNYSKVVFKNVSTVTITDTLIVSSAIQDSTNISLTTVYLNNSRLIYCNNLSISIITISYTLFDTVNTANLSFGIGSLMDKSRFDRVNSFTMSYLITVNISNLEILNTVTINLTSTLTTPTGLTISRTTIDNSSALNILELNSTITKVMFSNVNTFTIKYGNITNSSFISVNNLNFANTYPSSLVAANNQTTINDCLFETIDGLTFTPTTNDGSGITQYKINMSYTQFTNLGTVILTPIASSISNSITNCRFNNLQLTNISSVPNNAAAVRQLNYIQSEFENLNGSAAIIFINTPSISYSSIKNISPSTADSIAYRVALVKCKFEGNIKITDSVVTPDYTQVTTLTNCEGGGYFVKNSDATVSRTGFKVNKRINFTTVGINIDSAPADVSDTNYEVIDSTKIYGIQNVISGGNIVQTPVNLTLI